MLYQLSYTPRPWRDLCGEPLARKGSSVDDAPERPDHESGRPADQEQTEQSFAETAEEVIPGLF